MSRDGRTEGSVGARQDEEGTREEDEIQLAEKT